MFQNLNTTKPQRFGKMTKLPDGRGSVPTVCIEIPTPFGPERANEIEAQAREASICGPWSDQASYQMTDGELAYVRAVWDCLSGSSCWMSAFYQIQQGKIEEYQRGVEAYQKAYDAIVI